MADQVTFLFRARVRAGKEGEFYTLARQMQEVSATEVT